MASPVPTLTLTRVRATAFRQGGARVFLIELRGTDQDGRRLDGRGEGRPRGALTGDAYGSWEFLRECVRLLDGQTIPIGDPAAAAAAVAALTAQLHELASSSVRSAPRSQHPGRRRVVSRSRLRRVVTRLRRRQLRQLGRLVRAHTRPRSKPYRGTLAGVEAALMDLVAQGLGKRPADVFGARAAQVLADLPGPDDAAARAAVYEVIVGSVIGYLSYPPPPAPTYQGRPATVYDEVPYLRPLGSNGTKGHLLEREALRLGLSTTRFSKGAFTATDGVRPPLIFKWSRSPRSSAVSLALCTHKEATRLALGRAGVPVPKGRTFANGDYQAAQAFAERIGYPVVVKPAKGVRGIGVVANIRGPRELDRAFDHLANSRLGNDEFIVEQHITGRDYRIVVVGDEVIAAILREPASVVGDGEHNVAELIINKNVARRLNPHLWGRPIKYDRTAQFQLERAGLTLSSVPEAGQRVLLSSSCSLSQGGDSIDVLDELHPSIKDACVRAVKAVPGLWFCGVDFLVEDHTRPLAEQRAGICELNAHAAIGNCEYPLFGTPRQVARTVMEQCVDHFGLERLDKPADRLALRLTVSGRVTKVGYRRWMQRHAEEFGLAGWIRNLDRQSVEVVLVGDTAPASALAAAAVLGPKQARPTSVVTEHIAPPRADSFRILRRGSAEYAEVSHAD
jgi:D-alanine-D-alanine ligase-like ATP-grasp enzyme/acylphosphatase